MIHQHRPSSLATVSSSENDFRSDLVQTSSCSLMNSLFISNDQTYHYNGTIVGIILAAGIHRKPSSTIVLVGRISFRALISLISRTADRVTRKQNRYGMLIGMSMLPKSVEQQL